MQTSRVRVRVEPRCYQSADWSALIHKPVSFIVFYVVFEIIMAEKVVLAALENDDDLLLLSSLKEEKVLAYQKLDIDNLTNDQCRTMFRFEREDINILSNALRLPETIICNNRRVVSGVEGLCIVLRRLAYPCRLEDLEPVLGRTKVEISYIFNHVIDYLYNTHNHLLSDLSRDWLSYEHLRSLNMELF
jgi:hypothetical protein